ncbi:MAG: hypothetical protein ABI702_18545 [Burkholderiales bacterium]
MDARHPQPAKEQMNHPPRFDLFAQVESNPLMQGILPLDDIVSWGSRLDYDPRIEWRGRVLNASQESIAINQIDRVFTSTTMTAAICWGLHLLLFQSLIDQDPRLAENRKRIYKCAAHRGRDIETFPWFPGGASGAMIKGITRVGKTKVVERFTHYFTQVIVRPENEEYGWKELKQLVFLVVPMPADHSRHGFLLEAFKAIDAALGTKYAAQFAGARVPVEVQIVHLLCCLVVHRCGIVFIEEAQGSSLNGTFGGVYINFFLRLLNVGIPLVIIGNPLAFEPIDSHGQNVSRLSAGGSFNLDPAPSWTSSVWLDDVMPSVWGWNIYDERDSEIPELELDGARVELSQYIWHRTGGVSGYAVRLRKATLFVLKQKGGGAVTQADIEKAYQSPTMVAVHDIIEALTTKDASLLANCSDMPVAYFRSLWEAERAAAERAHALKRAAEEERLRVGRKKKEDALAANAAASQVGPAAVEGEPEVNESLEAADATQCTSSPAASSQAQPPPTTPPAVFADEDFRSSASRARNQALLELRRQG